MTTRPELAPRPGVGTEVWLEDLIGGPLPTVVLEVDDELLRLGRPRVGGREVPLPPHEPFTLTYRVREVPCEAPAELLPARLAGADPWVRLTAPPIRLQRRGHVRVPVRLLVHGDGRVPSDAGQPAASVAGVAENLSAGGVLVRLDRSFLPGDEVDLSIQCGGRAGTIEAVARVVRCEGGGRTSRPWRVAFAFVEIDPPARERVVRYLFERQRELRRRELEG